MQIGNGRPWETTLVRGYGSGLPRISGLGWYGLQGVLIFDPVSSGPETGHPPGEAVIWALETGGVAAWIRGSSSFSPPIFAEGVLVAEVTGLGSVSANGSLGISRAAVLNGTSSLDAPLLGQGTLVCSIQIGSRPSAEDIFYAIFDNPDSIEPGITLRQALRVLLSVAAGRTSIGTGDPVVVTFRSIGGGRNRVVAEMDKSERVVVALDTEDE